MREKLKTLPLAQLKEIAKAQGIKGLSGMKKSDLIELLCQRAEGTTPEETKKTEDTPMDQKKAETRAAGNQEAVQNEAIQETEEKHESKLAQAAAVQENKSEAPEGERIKTEPQKTEERRENVFRTGNRSASWNDRNRMDRNDRGRMNRGDRPMRQERMEPQAAADRAEQYDRQPVRRDMAVFSGEPAPAPEAVRERRVNPANITPQILAQFPDQTAQDIADLDSGIEANGILEVMPDGFGFIRCENFLPGDNDVYVAPSQIRRFNLKTGDIIVGNRRVKTAQEKFAALLYIRSVNGFSLQAVEKRPNFEDLTPVFPNQRLHMETPGRHNTTAMRVLDLLAPIGKGQRGMIVSPPKAGKTTLLKQVAQAITTNHPDMHLIILLIDERPEEVTDIRESVVGRNVEVIYSTFDELPDRHKRVSEMVIERARRLVEHGRDVIILLDSITRLARAYNLVVPPSGRTLSGGLDPAALHMPKRFFGAARNMREGGSLTVLATALVDTGSRMDDVIYEEFKGTGNMELVLDRKLSEKRIFPAIDILKSGTRNDHLLLTTEEKECVDMLRKATNSLKPDDTVEQILNMFARTRNNREFIDMARKTRFY